MVGFLLNALSLIFTIFCLIIFSGQAGFRLISWFRMLILASRPIFYLSQCLALASYVLSGWNLLTIVCLPCLVALLFF